VSFLGSMGSREQARMAPDVVLLQWNSCSPGTRLRVVLHIDPRGAVPNRSRQVPNPLLLAVDVIEEVGYARGRSRDPCSITVQENKWKRSC